MVNYIWPASLPAAPLVDGFSETLGANILRTPTDAGPAKMRYRGQRPDRVSCVYLMTTEQVGALDVFARDTLRGVRRFGWPHPRRGVQVEARFVPQEEGDLFSMSAAAPGLWHVGVAVEVLP